MTVKRACGIIMISALLPFTVIVSAIDAGTKFLNDFRTIDGTYNNPVNYLWGKSNIPLLRFTSIGYNDGISSPAGPGRKSAREISNIVLAQESSIKNTGRISDFLWQWGQFIDHDLDLTEIADPIEEFNIPVPAGDPVFDPDPDGTVKYIFFDRSSYEMDVVRQQMNNITAYIDASQVYGSDPARAAELRTLDGTGRLKTSRGRLLPFNINGFPNAGGPDPSFFLAGDVRANEQVALTALHTLFVREHNLWATWFKLIFPDCSAEEIYQFARAIVAAEMQAITYNEFLPLLLGPNALSPYDGYKPGVNVGISNAFSTAGFRFGHSMISQELLRLKRNGKPIKDGSLPLKEAFFNPEEISKNGIEPLLRGLCSQLAEERDSRLVDALRNFLFSDPGGDGFDLAALNIQRGRDHGLPDYNQTRIDFGLPAVSSFNEISSDPEVRQRLFDAYGAVGNIDLWVAGLAEDNVPGALVGETFHAILKDQFERLRDGDRFWYKIYLPKFYVRMIERRYLSKIIWQNTRIRRREIPRNVFIVKKQKKHWHNKKQKKHWHNFYE